MTPWEQMQSKGWDMDKDAALIYVGPRVEYGALKVLGQGYTLQEAMDNAAAGETQPAMVAWTYGTLRVWSSQKLKDFILGVNHAA